MEKIYYESKLKTNNILIYNTKNNKNIIEQIIKNI